MSKDERPGEQHDQDELIVAFAALGGRLTGDEFTRLLGSADYYRFVVRFAELLLAGDTATAEDVARDSLAALQRASSRLRDPETARAYLHQAVVNKARSIMRHRAISDNETPQASLDAPGAGPVATGGLDRESLARALRALPARQREAVVLHTYLDLSAVQAAKVMHISSGAAQSHLAQGLSSLRRLSLG